MKMKFKIFENSIMNSRIKTASMTMKEKLL